MASEKQISVNVEGLIIDSGVEYSGKCLMPESVYKRAIKQQYVKVTKEK